MANRLRFVETSPTARKFFVPVVVRFWGVKMRAFVRVGISAVASVLFFSQVAHAAPPPASGFSWMGFYLGVNAGYGWGRNDVDLTGDGATGAGNDLISRVFDGPVSFAPITRSQSINAKGAIGGVQFGYNWQFAPVWLAGLEADIQGSGLRGDTTTVSPTIALNLNSEQKLRWFGTVRGRLGFLINGQVLIFGTGGLAFGETDVSSNFITTGFGGASGGTTVFCGGAGTICLGAAESKTSIGWTAGAGFEWALTNSASVKVEYLHVQLADQTLLLVAQPPATGDATVTAQFRNAFDIVRAGVNLRF